MNFSYETLQHHTKHLPDVRQCYRNLLRSNLGKMGFFDDVVANYKKDNFRILEFLQSRPPSTPQEAVAPMKDFNVVLFRDCVIHNILEQRLELEPSTTQKLIEFLRGDFNDITKRITLQVMIHYTKMDVELQYRKYLIRGDMDKLPEAERLTKANFFDECIESFVTHANMDCGVDGVVWLLPEYTKKDIQNALCSKAMISAFEEAMKKLGSTPIPDFGKEIANLKIYGVKKFAPLRNLRGASLVDGILLCINNLAGYEGTAINKADMITLSAHECTHFLGRLMFNDFNFSSPSKCLSDDCQKRLDQVLPDTSLEMGWHTELLLFEGVQPNWDASTEEVATIFNTRLHTYTTYPIIRSTERKTLGLRIRTPASPPFGIDIEDKDYFC